MSYRTRLDPGSTKRRFVYFAGLLFLIHNPTDISALDLLRDATVRIELRITLLIFIFAVLLVLVRHMWTSFRLLGPTILGALLLSTLSLLWFIREWVTQNYMTQYFSSLMVITAYLTLGHVLPFYVRQLAGQATILRDPP
ncbi:hypothetical protein SAMN05660653_02457 [Desulfonatronum thiosulfatophilum]|uniref:Uncharacterized protein n=1 Tax=Desulfonatronum thiosulfatophilum TaxID=617002 RepID=A0A1G6DXP0_9BACT|nr:DUF6524 family protein [Desulfonatronum thiosulfatophilum]SDB49924.1 hypothetical protein SAMN05660653_02457 [Desulfonatronum thiosulfatophilum]